MPSLAAAGVVLCLATAVLLNLVLAGRVRLALAPMLLAPGGSRRRIARRLVDAHMVSAMEMLGALGCGAACVWWVFAWGPHSLSATAIGAVVMAAGILAAAPLQALLVGAWVGLGVTGSLAALVGLGTILAWTIQAWRADGDYLPTVVAVLGLLVCAVMLRGWAIRRLAAAQPV